MKCYLLGDNCGPDNGFVDGLLPILALFVCLLPKLGDVVKN